jgi:hypothetical protein
LEEEIALNQLNAILYNVILEKMALMKLENAREDKKMTLVTKTQIVIKVFSVRDQTFSHISQNVRS